ncbi:AsmA family protein [Chitinophaga eiseniae]|uniref:AsmA family protein n=1 Tax=Chitinophaga eiseniae TaxID=634771 RepID=A0A847S327_9BACT|nr:AsmA-like C-terminal region-containing protein [Chitinophaga eiseniae]NLR77700.1 AsmA family protein [Chitinophaga eiseniae]
MRKWLRIILLGCGILVALVVLLFLGMTWYIHANKTEFLKQLTAQLNDRLNGKLTIQDMEPSLLKSFPNVSIALKKVVLQDSLWQQHRHALVDVDYIFVRVNTLSLLRKYVDVNEVTLQDGTLFLYTDSTGYSNTYVLQGAGDKKKTSSHKDANIRQLLLRNINFVIDNRQKFKLFQLTINRLDGKVKASDSTIQVTVLSNILSKNFEFNTLKGSYLKDKMLQLNLSVIFNKHTKIMTVPPQEIRIDDHPVQITGQFGFGEKPPPFQLKINANQVLLKDAATWLPPNISTKLSSITLSKPLDAQADLAGHMKFRDTPDVRVTWKTTGNVLVTTMGEWTNCNFTGRFNNEVLPGRGHTDENSAVTILGLSANLSGVPLKADTIRVVNLKHPLLHGHFRSAFPLTTLNGATPDDAPILFKDGNADADLFYTGPLLKDDNTGSSLQGVVKVQNGAFTYLPRNLDFHDASATLRFTGQDLLLENIHIQSAKSSLQMDGAVKNLLNLYFTTPEKIAINWNIRSPLVDLNEFKSFLSPRKKAKLSRARQRAKMGRVSQQLDVVLASSNVNMQVLLDKVIYQRFTAQQVKAVVDLTNTDILLKQIALQHAGGNMQMAGNVHQEGNNNYFQVNATVNNVHINQLFYAFNNFGLDGLTAENLKGNVSAKVNLKGNILDNGTLAKRSLSGSVNFNLRNGALLNFGPLADIGNFAFRKRHLDSITFENLSNTFQIAGNKITIPPMRIASSAVNIDVQGVYGLDGGTNINLDVPLRNPAKDADITDKEEKRKRSRRGIVLHLRAVSEKDGKVKIKLGKGDGGRDDGGKIVDE